MKKILLSLLFISFLFGSMRFSDPKPTFENPRKWVIKVNNNDISRLNHTLNAVNNVLKAYPQETLKIALIFYAQGIRAIRKDFDKKILSRIRSLMEYEIEIIACKNTMDTMGWSKKDLIDDKSVKLSCFTYIL